MAPVVVNENAVREFADPAALESWYAAHHDTTPELWLKIHKKASGLLSVTYAESLDVALCWGWIDGIKKGFNEKSFLQRYTPRGRKSIWSRVNIRHIERLRTEGRMQPSGEAQVRLAEADGRWARAYGDFKEDGFPPDLKAAIDAEPDALAMFGQLSAQNRYALAFRTHNMKTAAGRVKKIADLVEMLKRGETPYPNGKPK